MAASNTADGAVRCGSAEAGVPRDSSGTAGRYRMMKVRAGLYVMPTNDRRALVYAWQVLEDGVVDNAGRPVAACWAYGGVRDDEEHVVVARDEDGLLVWCAVGPGFCPEPGSRWGSFMATRRAAFADALSVYAERAGL